MNNLSERINPEGPIRWRDGAIALTDHEGNALTISPETLDELEPAIRIAIKLRLSLLGFTVR